MIDTTLAALQKTCRTHDKPSLLISDRRRNNTHPTDVLALIQGLQRFSPADAVQALPMSVTYHRLPTVKSPVLSKASH